MTLEQKARAYFAAFENKDLDQLSDMFTPIVTLKDWNLSVFGRPAVLEANAKIFNDIEKIKIDVQKLHMAGLNVVIAELLIMADEEEPLPVVDIITWTTRGPIRDRKISSIVAYRGN